LQNIKNSKGFFQSYTCGYPHRNLINRIKKINPHKIIIAMDNDPFGKKIARDLASLLKITYSVEIAAYKEKDPNDLLKKIIRIKQ